MVYRTLHSIAICLLLFCCSGGRSLFAFHITKHLVIASSVHFCTFFPKPEEAVLLTPIFLPSSPLHSGLGKQGLPLNQNGYPLEHYPLDFRLGHYPIAIFIPKRCRKRAVLLVLADLGRHMVCFLVFLAAYPLCTINTINVHNTISNMLQFKCHLILYIHRAYEAFPAIHLYTFSMLIWV